MRRLLTLSQNLKPSFPNLNPHVSAFFQHAEALNDKKKKKTRNQSLRHPDASRSLEIKPPKMPPSNLTKENMF